MKNFRLELKVGKDGEKAMYDFVSKMWDAMGVEDGCDYISLKMLKKDAFKERMEDETGWETVDESNKN